MKKGHILILSVLLNILIVIGAFTLFDVSAAPLLGIGAPTVVSYQGVVKDSGSPYTGKGYFKFAVVDERGLVTYWSNDGTSTEGGEPTDGVELIVANGLFQVLLGDTLLDHMTALPASTFEGSLRYLRVWFSADGISYTLLSPDQQIAAVPYALKAQDAELAEEALHAADADTLDGLDSTDFYTQAEVDSLLAGLEGRIEDLETILASVSLENGGDDLVFTDVNVHVRSGSGATDGTVNGRGNLIIGYHEDDGGDATRTGSHNLIVGDEHSFSSYGGFLAGYQNIISGPYSTVSGGYLNQASGERSSISGGGLNTASAFASSLGGGANNIASGSYSSISGGRYNIASGNWSVVVGGGDDEAYDGNEAWAFYSVVVGGKANIAGDESGGDRNVGDGSVVSGGGGNETTANLSSVSGGLGNTASGVASSVNGGATNTASGQYASVCGGEFNQATFYAASVTGGHANTASGGNSSVSGGENNTASGDYSSVYGSNWQTADTQYDYKP